LNLTTRGERARRRAGEHRGTVPGPLRNRPGTAWIAGYRCPRGVSAVLGRGQALTGGDRLLVAIFNRRGPTVMVMLLFVASGTGTSTASDQ
jgi:hypothetical protein